MCASFLLLYLSLFSTILWRIKVHNNKPNIGGSGKPKTISNSGDLDLETEIGVRGVIRLFSTVVCGTERDIKSVGLLKTICI